jgi:hypothetical protein
MSQLVGEITWNLRVTNRELLIINRALRLAISENEVREAEELSVGLSRQRAAALENMTRTAGQLNQAVGEPAS